MCGIVGWINNKEKIIHKSDEFNKMVESLSGKGKSQTKKFISDNLLFGNKIFSKVDINNQQLLKYQNYVIIYNGEVYNSSEIKNNLTKLGYTFDTYSDAEVILKAYLKYKEKVLDILEGVYAFAIYDGKKTFLARDRLGVKPLFFSKSGNNFFFASEIKALLKNNLIKPIINKKSLQELLSLGPSRTPGCGIFKDIFELKPGHYGMYINKFKIYKYWDVSEKRFNDNLDQTINKVRSLLTSSIEEQMKSDVDISAMLSGGIDSSIITCVCCENLKKQAKKLNTYSIGYENEEKYFKKNDYQVTLDNYFINLVQDKYETNHKYVLLKEQDLAKNLEKSLFARDYPGMADIDASLYCFGKEIKQKVVLSGECADEIFAGYPWFYKENLINQKGFPWINNIEIKEKLLLKKQAKKLKLKKYMLKQYKKTIKKMPKVKYGDKKHKQMIYINLKWFMANLLERTDRMTMILSLKTRVPFASHKLIEYLWNVPFEYKFINNQEKGLLREAFKELLPEEIRLRKKNPYPKTHNPDYTNIVSEMLKKRLSNEKSLLFNIFDKEKIIELLNQESNNTPWYGQLMSYPQLIAYLYQFDVWLEKYNIVLEI